MNDTIELSDNEMALLDLIATTDNITPREALSQAIYLFASKVDYTKNVATPPAA